MNRIKNSYIFTILSIMLVLLILAGSAFGVFLNVTKGEETDCKSAAEAYNSEKKDFSFIFEGTGTKEDLSKEITAFDAAAAEVINTVDVDSLIYTDKTASLLTRYVSELTKNEFTAIDFSVLKGDFSEAYKFISEEQKAEKSWADISVIPFGIEPGDKEAFIEACATSVMHLQNTLISAVISAPSAYYDALVPLMESMHTEPMPSLIGLAANTGPSVKAIIEFMIEKVLTVIEPIKTAPLTFLFDMLPDVLINYEKSAEFINGNEKLQSKIGLTLPSVEEIMDTFFSVIGMTAPEIDFDYLKKMGTASIGESGGNNGKRVVINGDREVITAYIASFIANLLTYEDNFKIIERVLTVTLKSPSVKQSVIGDIMASTSGKNLFASFVNIFAMLEPTQKTDVAAEVKAYNSEEKDFSNLFRWPATKDSVASTVNALDSRLAGLLADGKLEAMLYTDSFATIIIKFTAGFCDKEFSELGFSLLQDSFPEAYKYVKDEQAKGKTWADIRTIPFGIKAGDREMFLRACGAGAEHFSDALALSLLINPLTYDKAYLPLLESLHTGPAPDLKQFISEQGFDSQKIMEEIISLVLTFIEPFKTSPITYLTDILPDLIYGYKKAQAFLESDPQMPLSLPDFNAVINDLLSDFGIVLPEYDFSSYEKMATASTVRSGHSSGERMMLTGDREVIFISLASFLVSAIRQSGNLDAVMSILGSINLI